MKLLIINSETEAELAQYTIILPMIRLQKRVPGRWDELFGSNDLEESEEAWGFRRFQKLPPGSYKITWIDGHQKKRLSHFKNTSGAMNIPKLKTHYFRVFWKEFLDLGVDVRLLLDDDVIPNPALLDKTRILYAKDGNPAKVRNEKRPASSSKINSFRRMKLTFSFLKSLRPGDIVVSTCFNHNSDPIWVGRIVEGSKAEYTRLWSEARRKRADQRLCTIVKSESDAELVAKS